MKIAVCLVGQIRTGTVTYANLHNYFGNLLPMCDFFIHTWDVNTPSPGIELPIEFSAEEHAVKISDEDIKKYYERYKPLIMSVDSFSRYKAANYPTIKNLHTPLGMPFYHSLSMALQYKNLYEKSYNFSYDYVVVARHDSCVSKERSLQQDIDIIKDNNGFLFYDMHNTEKKIDSTIWVSNSTTINRLKRFNEIRIELEELSDDQEHLYKWIKRYCGKTIFPIKEHYWVYRNFHKENNIDIFSITDQKLFEIKRNE